MSFEYFSISAKSLGQIKVYPKNKRSLRKDEPFVSDSNMQYIEKCLNCKKPRCTNCIDSKEQKMLRRKEKEHNENEHRETATETDGETLT